MESRRLLKAIWSEVAGKSFGGVDEGILQRTCDVVHRHVGRHSDEAKDGPHPEHLEGAVGKVDEDEGEAYHEDDEEDLDRLDVREGEGDVLGLRACRKPSMPSHATW